MTTNRTIEEIGQELAEEFALFGDDWESKYEHLIDLGRHLKPMAGELKTGDNLIQGCQSRAWLSARCVDGHVYFDADSEGLISRGMIALMVRVLSGQKARDIADARLTFIEQIGLMEHLAMTRGNGLVSMIEQMKREALKCIKN